MWASTVPPKIYRTCPKVDAMDAPPLRGRVYYVVGGVLPDRYRPWVSRDLTAPGWRRRQACRPLLMMVPFAVAFALLPGQLAARLAIAACLLAAALGLGFATSGVFRDRRLVQHGFPPAGPSRRRPRRPTEDEILDALDAAAAADAGTVAATAATAAAGAPPGAAGVVATAAPAATEGTAAEMESAKAERTPS
jgi:hypothetical protein